MNLTREQADDLRRRRPGLFAQEPASALGAQKAAESRAEAVFDDAVEKFTVEKTLQIAAEKWLRLNGAVGIVRSRMDRPTSNGVGTPDFIFGWPRDGRLIFCAAEAKVGNRHCTPPQAGFLLNVQEAGGIAFVFRSLDELKANLL